MSVIGPRPQLVRDMVRHGVKTKFVFGSRS